jgi:hypothetical protein
MDWILPDFVRCMMMEQGLREMTELLLGKLEELQRAKAAQIAQIAADQEEMKAEQEEMEADINTEAKAR